MIARTSLKIFAFCFLVLSLQVAVLSSVSFIDVNLPLLSIIAFASLVGILENVIASLFFAMISSMLVYDSQIFWLYPLVAMLACKLNPKQIANKFFICIVYTIILTPIIELLNPSSTPYLMRIIEATMTNVAFVIPLYFIVKILFIRSRNLYSSLRA